MSKSKDQTPAVDPERLERAMMLRAQTYQEFFGESFDDRAFPDIRSVWYVQGSNEAYRVTQLAGDPFWECECGDNHWREFYCKHILSVLFKIGDQGVLDQMMEICRQRRAAARASAAKSPNDS